MTRTAFCRKSPRVPRVCWLGSWALGTSDRGGQDKANWRSRTRRPSAVEKCLSAHWFLKRTAGGQRHSIGVGWRLSGFATDFNELSDGGRDLQLECLRLSFDFLRFAAILCASTCRDTCVGRIRRGSSSLMATDQSDDFHVRPGRVGNRGTRINPRGNMRSQPFLKQVQVAVRRAGGNPNRIGRGPTSVAKDGRREERSVQRARSRCKSSSRYSCGKVITVVGNGIPAAASGRVVSPSRRGSSSLMPRDGSRVAWSRRARAASKAVDAHLRYLERDGVNRDGEKGKAYSALEDEADSKAFVERGREDRHQFRFIVAPEDSNEMADLRGFTRDLMRQVEKDLETRLDWIAIDHYNTGHPHTHIIVRGVLEDGGILNIAGDYIAHGIRHRASELVTLELGHQSELELQAKLKTEVEAERWTRLDKMLATEQHEKGILDLRPGEGTTYAFRENRGVMIGRVKFLERYGLASEVETGQWVISDRAEATLKELSDRNDIIKTMHRALAAHGLEEERGIDQYVRHGARPDEKIIGRILAKGLAGDEMDERVYLVIDGVDGRVHHVELSTTPPI